LLYYPDISNSVLSLSAFFNVGRYATFMPARGQAGSVCQQRLSPEPPDWQQMKSGNKFSMRIRLVPNQPTAFTRTAGASVFWKGNLMLKKTHGTGD
jgi:hypothetical protein